MYWDPFDELDRMHQEMDRLFRRSFFGEERPMLEHKGDKGSKTEIAPWKAARAPVCHMHETETKIIAAFELPGVDKSDIELNVNERTIDLKVESKTEKKHEDREKGAYSYAMQSQSFYRSVPLPKEVSAEKAVAEYKDGVLRVELPKKHSDEAKARRLQIK